MLPGCAQGVGGEHLSVIQDNKLLFKKKKKKKVISRNISRGNNKRDWVGAAEMWGVRSDNNRLISALAFPLYFIGRERT